MARKPKISPPRVNQVEPLELLHHVGWGLGAVAWALLTFALVSYDAADWPGRSIAPHNKNFHNWIGRYGAYFADQIYLMIGPGVWIFMTAMLIALVSTARQKPVTQPVLRLIGVIIMTLTVSAMIGLGMPTFTNAPQGSGGLVAIFINGELGDRFNTLGTFIILGVIFWVGALLAIDHIVLAVPKLIGKAIASLPKFSVPKPVLVGRFPMQKLWGGKAQADDADAEETAPRGRRNKAAAVGVAEEDEDGPIDEDAGGLGATESFDPDAATSRRKGKAEKADKTGDAVTKAEKAALASAKPGESVDAEVEPEDDDTEEAKTPGEEDDEAGDAPGAYVAQKRQFDPEALRARIKQLPINFAPRPKAAGVGGLPGAASPSIDLDGYAFPPLDILIEPESNFTDEMERMVKEQAMHLESALQQYRIEGNVVGIDSGPVITLYEVRLAPGTKVSVLAAISSDLARALKAHNIRIVPNMAGKDTVGIEVPNLVKEKVRLKELMTSNADQVAKMALPMFLGKDASGNALIADLAAMPHMLIAGTTGSGKSVCMNSIIMSFMFTKRPDQMKMVLVDPKMVEMSQFKDIPHLMCPVVTEMSKAAAILEWATTKMDERYELLAEAGVRDVASYNNLTWDELKERFAPANEEEEARIPKKLPYLVFIIDELADLMMTNKEVEGFIVRLAQKSRAVGMHLILATQRPQANVVTGLIKSNMPCRVSFKVASGMDSRIVLDQKGAELLLGQGDMLYLSPRTSKLTRAQGTLVDDDHARGVGGDEGPGRGRRLGVGRGRRGGVVVGRR
ncbi:MAG: DNA translocase FtsK [Planctomycetota bacterium]|nr:DNA translocase FtsK [Planctomycetota bacterium]